MKMNQFILRYAVVFFLILVTACTSEKGELKGYLGSEGGNSADGTTSPSNAIVMTPSTVEIIATEGQTVKALVLFSKPLPRPVTLNWEILQGDSDFQVTSGVISAAADAQTVEVEFEVKTDSLFEGNERFFLKISGDVNVFLGPAMYPIVIQETGSPLEVSVFGPGTPGVATQQINENDVAGGTDIFVRLNSAAGFPVQVSYTISGNATLGVDYTLSESNSVTFAPGETSKKIRFNLIDDNLGESPETAVLTLNSVLLGQATIDNTNKIHTVNIIDNDLGSRFEILGVRGGTDTLLDGFLTNGTEPTIIWSNALDEQEYLITIKNMSNATVCNPMTIAPEVTQRTIVSADCLTALTQGTTYKVVAEVKVAGVYYPASNSDVFTFTIDDAPPATFKMIGVFGGEDIEPDQYLAGSLFPAVSWQNTTGESGYRASILAQDGVTVICDSKEVPANVTSINFGDCELVRGSRYKATVEAFDLAGNVIVASNSNYEFLVTEVASGFRINGVTGGTGDVTPDSDLNDAGDISDPFSFSVDWTSTGGITRYVVTILNSNSSQKCAPVQVTTNQATISNCSLDLNYNYLVRVIGYDINNVEYPAVNSPYQFVYKKGLYLSGVNGVKSYYRGVPITNCGGGSKCDSVNPYRVNVSFQEDQIVIGPDAVLTGGAYTTGSAGVGNGKLEITARIIRIEDNGLIQMNGTGYVGSVGTGKGLDGATFGTGAAHGGNGTMDSVRAQAKAYGTVKDPNELGSGGGSSSLSATNGGVGGGIISLTAQEELAFKTGYIQANGTAGGVNSGGGSGGSIIINAKKISGISGNIAVRGGHGNGLGGPGSGGRLAVMYEEVTHTGGLSGISFGILPGQKSLAETTLSGGSSGTLFTKNTKTVGGDQYGYLSIDLGSIFKHTAGVETPIPLFDAGQPTSHLFDAIYSKGQATYIIEATKAYTLQSTASPPALDYRLVVEGDIVMPSASTIFRIAAGGYLEWRKLAQMTQFTDLIVSSGGTLAHSPNRSSVESKLDIVADEISVFGTISADSAGYGATQGAVGSVALGVEGAGHGGQGGYFADINSRGTASGKIAEPDIMGSGSAVVSGGGLIKITANNQLNLSGKITANGAEGCGGGAGGSVWVNATSIVGSGGSISSQGGGSFSGNCGGGGGGRVAVYYGNTTYAGGITGIRFLVAGGDALVDGAAGTVYHKKTLAPSADAKGHLMVLNQGLDYNEQVVTPIYTVNSAQMDSITTDTRGTLLISSNFAPGTEYVLPSDAITYRVVAQGDFALPTSGHLQILDGGYLEVRRNTPYTFTKLTVTQNAILTHSKNTDAVKRYLLHFILNDFDLLGTVDVVGRGYPEAVGPGAAGSALYGAGHGGYGGNSGKHNTVLGGAPYAEADIKNPTDFGSGTTNVLGYTPGASGGGAARFQISNDFNFSGQILADGMSGICTFINPSTYCSGGASGGSIFVTTKNIKGVNGTLSANGGNGAAGSTQSYSGSGGRIALVYEDDTQYTEGTVRNLINYEKIRAFGGTLYSRFTGAAGSIFIQESDAQANGDLIYNNSNNPHPQKVETPAPTLAYDSLKTMNNATLLVKSAQTFTFPTNLDYRIVVEGTAVFQNDLNIKNKGYLEWRKNASLNWQNLRIESGGTLTHSYNYTTTYNSETLNTDFRLDISVASNFTLDGGGLVDVSGRGYQPGYGQGTSTGASHGGQSGSGALPYGDYKNPRNQGSGGASGVVDASGGGIVRIATGGTTTLNGNIYANGGSGGASGGSIKIQTATLQGETGSLRANAGDGGTGGSGGRIAVLFSTDNYPISYLNMSAYGGKATVDGAAGTIFYQHLGFDTYGHLIVNNAGRTFNPGVTTVLPTDLLDSVTVDTNSGVEVKTGETVRLPNANVGYKLIVSGNLLLPTSTDTLIVENGGILEIRNNLPFGEKPAGALPPADGVIRQMIVKPLGTVRHTHTNNSYLSPNYSVNLTLHNLVLQGRIDAAGRGPITGGGQNNVTYAYAATHAGLAGGYYAVPGYWGELDSYSSRAYGSIKNPTATGSGSGSANGRGGGLVLIDVNRLEIAGQIDARGTRVVNTATGAGSGGSINIKSKEIVSAGAVLNASGIQGQVVTGSDYVAFGSGGGRIAVNCSGTVMECAGMDSLTSIATGGAKCSGCYASGGAGTVYLKGPSDTNGRLVINNGNIDYTLGADSVINTSDDFDSITIGSATTGLYVPASVTVDLKTSDVFFPLRLRGDVKFSNFVQTGTPATDHFGDVRILEGGSITFFRDQNFNSTYAIKDNPFIYRNFTMEPGSTVTHYNTLANNGNDLAVYIVTRDHFHLKSDAKIDVSGRGYLPNMGPGSGLVKTNGNAYGPPISATITYSSVSVGSGASYGGKGGGFIRYRNGLGQPILGKVCESRATYGDTQPENPLRPGSGGGSASMANYGSTSTGGGLVILRSENLMTLEGSILANGTAGGIVSTTYGLGGGSGGAINIQTQTLQGSYANLQARGGDGGYPDGDFGGGGGGGGRIGIGRTVNSYTGSITYDVSGGFAYDDVAVANPNYYIEAPVTSRLGADGTFIEY